MAGTGVGSAGAEVGAAEVGAGVAAPVEAGDSVDLVADVDAGAGVDAVEPEAMVGAG